MPAATDVAWVDVLPSMKGFLPSLMKEVGASTAQAGRKAGQDFGSSFGASAAGQVEQASQRMSAALRKVQDATGQVHVAEARLQQLREGGKASGAQLVTAEENLARARRNETGANEQLSAATRRVSDAQTQHSAAVRAGSAAMDDGTRKAGLLSRGFNTMQGAVAAGFAAFYAAQGAINFIGSALGAARDLGETINKSNVIFGANAARIDEWAKGAARALGLSRQAALETAAQFGNMYSQLGFSADAAADMSIKTVQMAADLGSFNNLPTADVAQRIAAGFRGEYDSLQLLIPNISAARVEQEAMAATGKTNADQLTAQEKAAAVLAIVQKDGAAAMGDFARTSDGLANSQRILSAEWDNAKARLGEFLVGPATALVHWLTDAIPKMMAFGKWFGDNIGVIGIFAGVMGGLVAVTYAHNTAMAISAAGGMAQWLAQTRIITAVSSAWTAVQWLLNASIMGFPLVWIVGALVAVGAGLYALWTRSETFRDIVMAVWDAIQTAIAWAWNSVIRPAWEAMQTVWAAVVTGMKRAWETVLEPAWNAIATVFTWLWTVVLEPYLRALWNFWTAVLTGIMWAWENILRPVWNAIAAAGEVLFKILSVAVFIPIQIAWATMTTLMELAWNTVLKPMWDALAAAAGWLWDKVLRPVFGAIGTAWDALMRAMRTVYDNVIHPMWTVISGAIEVLRQAFQTAVSGIKSVWDTMMAIAATPINFIMHWVLNDGLLKAWNAVMGWIGLDRLKVGTLNPIHVNGGTPGWASGGMIPGPYVGPAADNVPGYVPMAGGGAMPIRVNPREFIEPVSAVNRYGVDFMEAVRTGQFPLELAMGWAPGGEITWPRLNNWAIENLKPKPVITSTIRPGANDYHGAGQAIDISNPGNNLSVNNGYAAAIARAFGNITELIHNPNGSIKNGKAVPSSFWGAATWAAHLNHVHWAMTPAALGSIGKGSGIGGGFADAAQVYQQLVDSIKRVGEVVGNNPFVDFVKHVPGALLGKMWDLVKDQVAGLFASRSTNDVNLDAAAASSGVPQRIVQAYWGSQGWNNAGQWTPTVNLVQKESSWNPKAQNPTSSASGLFQHIDSTWRANRPSGNTLPHMKDAQVTDQAYAGAKYIKSAYGTPAAAWAFWQAHHWYGEGGQPRVLDDGGLTPPGWWFNGTGDIERVLTPDQTRSFDRLVAEITDGDGPRAGGSDGRLAEHLHLHQEGDPYALLDELGHRIEVIRLGGRYLPGSDN